MKISESDILSKLLILITGDEASGFSTETYDVGTLPDHQSHMELLCSLHIWPGLGEIWIEMFSGGASAGFVNFTLVNATYMLTNDLQLIIIMLWRYKFGCSLQNEKLEKKQSYSFVI